MGAPQKSAYDPAPVAAAWQRLEAFVASLGGPSLALEPAATEKAVAAAEKAMTLAFPPDYRASLRLHDGQGDGATFPWMPGCLPLASVDTLVELWKKQQKSADTKDRAEPGAKLKSGVVRAAWIPIADGTYLDLDPGPGGVAGQLLTRVTKRDLVVIDTSFLAALERWVSVLERGIWVHDAGQHSVRPRALPELTAHPAGLFSRR